MLKILITKPGSYESFEFHEEPDPHPAPQEYRIKVAAAGVNFADTIIRNGLYAAAKGRYPLTPGFEYAGIIDAMGEGADTFKLGDRVLGFTLFGGYASCQVKRSTDLWRVPENISLAQAASLPATHLTAWYALQQVAHVKKGEVVLVHSAAGGVGLALLQQAKILGCETIAVVGNAAKADAVRQYGATHVIVRDKYLWKNIDKIAPSGIDVAFDANGITTLKPAFQRLRAGGRLVVYGFAEMLPRGKKPFFPLLILNWLRIPRFSPFQMTARNRSVHGFNLAFLSEKPDLAAEAMAAICEWAAQGHIKASPLQEIRMQDVAHAHRLLESGRTTGKIVLTFP